MMDHKPNMTPQQMKDMMKNMPQKKQTVTYKKKKQTVQDKKY